QETGPQTQGRSSPQKARPGYHWGHDQREVITSPVGQAALPVRNKYTAAGPEQARLPALRDQCFRRHTVFHRTLNSTLILIGLLFLSSAGCKKDAPLPPVKAGEAEILLLLPNTEDTSGYTDRVTTLKIDNKDIEEKPERKRTLKVEPEQGK